MAFVKVWQKLKLTLAWREIHVLMKVKPSYAELKRLLEMYESPGRHYHTIEHIYQCIKLIDKLYRKDVRHTHLVKLAIFYHDCVYDVEQKDNEQASAKIFEGYADRHILSQNVYLRKNMDLVRDLILMTAGHKVERDDNIFMRIMNDVDMSIMGADPASYMKYARNVWIEYSKFGKESYIKGRLAFLESIDPWQLFHTPQMFNRYLQARQNIRNEINILRTSPDEITGWYYRGN